MKNILKYITSIIVAAFALTGCHERYVTYSDAEYVMFADTMAIYPVQKADSTFVIPVVSTVKKDYDRTFAVEIIDKGNNAIEKKHYRLESNTITIKAGATRALCHRQCYRKRCLRRASYPAGPYRTSRARPSDSFR